MTTPDHTARALREAVRRLILAQGALHDGHRPCGTPLPTPHAWALLELRRHGPMTVTALAARINLDRTNVSRLCARMESLGEIDRAPHPDDRRARLIQLTEAGERVARSVDLSSAAHFAGVLDRLDADPTAVVNALTTLARAIAPDLTDLESP